MDSGRKLQRLGYWILLAGFVVIVLRIRIAQTLLPTDLVGCALFEIGELFLIPGGLLLALLGKCLKRVPLELPRASLLVGVAALALLSIIYSVSRFVVVPVVAKNLEWGHYGAGPPVALSAISEVQEITALSFPAGANLLDGECLGGWNPYLVAVVSLPASDVDVFLSQPLLREQLQSSSNELARGAASPDFGPVFARRGWHVERVRDFLSASLSIEQQPLTEVIVLVDLDRPLLATVYVVWYAL